ncbi:DDE superfamily endonuclease [Phytophthora infestans]|uniref:DDE superfamily endonuclease n=1 Tax=Phytophthora infestans TaxID=4787 RepID=A0A833T084_PHYIN|nr:DDE superfamily endonuclease [Phytophthora infestans]
MQLDVKLTQLVVLVAALLAIDMDIGELFQVGTAEFGRSPEVISFGANTIASMIYDKIKDKMVFDHRMIERLKQSSTNAIFTNVGRLRNGFGIIDGTVRRICRPIRHQEQAYSGHKKMHAIKLQSIFRANGLNISLYGPVEGHRHDGYMLRPSEMVAEMEKYLGFLLYGDQD